MRIACIHVPQLSLQCATRVDPALRGAPVVVVGARPDGVKSGPVVLACSRAAYALGARVGVLAASVRGLSHDLVVVAADPLRERETVRAIADAVLALSPLVDLGGRVGAGGAHQAIYCEVPAKHKGASFGERVIGKLESLGLSGRIGIADDRFTAWVAASDHHHVSAKGEDESVVSVPRGGSAAFLAHRPLSLLSISGEVQHMLEALGVSTLGEFAALPEPSVARPLEADYQALARGEGERHMPPLRPYAPDAPIREEIEIARADAKGAAPSLSAAVGIVAERVALRLEGRDRGAAKLEVHVTGAQGERILPVVPVGSAAARTSLEALLVKPGTRGNALITGADALADTLAEALRAAAMEEGVWRIAVAVTGEAIVGDATSQVEDEAETAPILDTLSVVLSGTGGSLDLGLPLGLPLVAQPAPTAGVLRERSEAHRRTRKGKQRKRELPSVIQPKLFKG